MLSTFKKDIKLRVHRDYMIATGNPSTKNTKVAKISLNLCINVHTQNKKPSSNSYSDNKPACRWTTQTTKAHSRVIVNL